MSLLTKVMGLHELRRRAQDARAMAALLRRVADGNDNPELLRGLAGIWAREYENRKSRIPIHPDKG